MKKSRVVPELSVPYSTWVCCDRSSAELMGVTMRSTVRKAARLAVYDEIRISVKNHHTAPTIRPETDLVPKLIDIQNDTITRCYDAMDDKGFKVEIVWNEKRKTQVEKVQLGTANC